MIQLVRPITVRATGNGNHDGNHCVMRLALQLKDYRLTTAEILYRLPDHPSVLQSFIWQDLDIAPRYPVLSKFLAFWEKELEGPVHSGRVGSATLITADSVRHNQAVFYLH